MRVYLDHNATAPLRPQCAEIVGEWGNGSAIHGRGRHVRSLIESARSKVASLLGVPQRGIIFTSGATEANNFLLKGYQGSVITSLLEHPSVLKARADAHIVALRPDGVIDLEALEKALQNHVAPLVSVMAAHNETGVIQPIREALRLTRRYGGFFHTDAVQAYGKADVPYDACDYVTLSGHKLGAFPGVGVLYAHSDAPLSPLHHGGGQEYGLRAGTENVMGIQSMALAMELARNDPWEMIGKWRDELEECLMNVEDTVRVVSRRVERLANTILISKPKMPSSTIVMKLDLAGFEISAGSACHSGKVRTTGALEAMNIPQSIRNSVVRISIPYNTTRAQVMSFAKAWENLN